LQSLNNLVYLDNAATTIVADEYAQIFLDYAKFDFFNPSAPYSKAVKVALDLQKAREDILKSLRGEGHIVFTSSGTEADNLALFGCVPRGGEIIISAAEHAAVYNTALELKQRGITVKTAEVDTLGRVKFDSFVSLLSQNTSLVSIIHVSNETGAVNDIKSLCYAAKRVKNNIIFHSDGVQAAGKADVNLSDLNVDLYSMSAHKLHAPKGVGALYIKNGVSVKPMLFGGGQDKFRSSTENSGGIIAFSRALSDAVKLKTDVSALKNKLISLIDPCVIRVISDESCLPYIISLALKNVRGEVMLHALEKHNVIIGTGSACTSKKGDNRFASVLRLPREYENGIIRVSLSRLSTESDVERFVTALKTEYKALSV